MATSQTPPADHPEDGAAPPADPMSDALQLLLLAHTRAQAALARRLGASRSDVDALEHLMVGPLGPGDLAARLGITPGAVTQMIARFEQRDHARRTPDPSDGRRGLIELTDEGRETVHRHVWPLLLALDDLGRRLADRDAHGAQAVVDYLLGAAEAMASLVDPVEPG